MSNLIVNDNKKYTVDPLYQWDKNQVLNIYGLNILNPEIHFINEVMSCTIEVTPTVDYTGVISAQIPNSLLQKPYSITVYISGYEDSTFKTYCKVVIPVKKRARPGDYTIEADDGEVYSFKTMSKKIEELEKTLGNTSINDFYSYTYNAVNNKLVESKGTYVISKCINLVSTSLKSIVSIIDKLKTSIDANIKTATEALSIAKGKNRALVFNTTEDMNNWLSDISNKGKHNVGDNIYIVDVEVPDWWISEVLTDADENTGFYYKVAQLETQKVDIEGHEIWTNPDKTIEFPAQTITVDTTKYNKFVVMFRNTNASAGAQTLLILDKTESHIMHCVITSAVYVRRITVRDNEIVFTDCNQSSQGTTSNNFLMPLKVIAYV